jgi:hypothetical protein
MRKLILAWSAITLLAALAACSSSTTKKGDSMSSAGPGGATGQAPPAGPGGKIAAAQLIAQATAATDQAQTVKVKMSTAALGLSITGTGAVRFGGNDIAESLTENMASVGQIRAVVIDGDIYLKVPGLGTAQRPWVKNPPEVTQFTDGLKQSDPRQMLQLLAGVGTVTPTGQETVDGVQTTHYSVDVDLAKTAKLLPPGLAKVLQTLIRQGVTHEGVQLWVDSQKRPVRVATSVLVPDPRDAGTKTTSSTTIDYYGWGAPVSITAPSPGLVTVAG